MRIPRFEIFRSPKDEQFYFRLKAKNGKIILSSEGYTQKHNCSGGILAVQLLNCTFEIENDLDFNLHGVMSWYWFRMRVPNGECIGRSETYTTKAGAKRGISSVRKNSPIAEIVDLTGEI